MLVANIKKIYHIYLFRQSKVYSHKSRKYENNIACSLSKDFIKKRFVNLQYLILNILAITIFIQKTRYFPQVFKNHLSLQHLNGFCILNSILRYKYPSKGSTIQSYYKQIYTAQSPFGLIKISSRVFRKVAEMTLKVKPFSILLYQVFLDYIRINMEYNELFLVTSATEMFSWYYPRQRPKISFQLRNYIYIF